MKSAILYRMILPEHECPYGVRAKQMLGDAGWTVDEHILKTRDEVEAFKLEHQVATTPQVIVDGKRIGGSDDLARFLEQKAA